MNDNILFHVLQETSKSHCGEVGLFHLPGVKLSLIWALLTLVMQWANHLANRWPSIWSIDMRDHSLLQWLATKRIQFSICSCTFQKNDVFFLMSLVEKSCKNQPYIRAIWGLDCEHISFTSARASPRQGHHAGGTKTCVTAMSRQNATAGRR